MSFVLPSSSCNSIIAVSIIEIYDRAALDIGDLELVIFFFSFSSLFRVLFVSVAPSLSSNAILAVIIIEIHDRAALCIGEAETMDGNSWKSITVRPSTQEIIG